MREKKHERKCRGTSRGMGRNVKKSHGEAGKDRKPFSQSRGNRKRPFCGRQQNGFGQEARESGKRQGTENGPAGKNRGKTQTVRNFRTVQKIKAQTGAGADKPKKRREKLSRTEETGQTPACFLSAGAGEWGEGEEKRHAGGHDARRAIGHSI